MLAIIEFIKIVSMLNKLKNKDKAKKDTKKNTVSKTDPKDEAKEDEETQEQEQNTDLVDASELKKDEKAKVKVSHNNRNEYQLQQKQVDIASLAEATKAKNDKPKQITTWVTNTVEEVMEQKNFKMDDRQHEFMSLTDQELNKKLLEKQKEEEEKQKSAPITFQNNLKIQTIQKSRDQLAMERAEGTIQFSKPMTSDSANTGISSAGTAINFTNSGFNNLQSFKPIEKSAQQLRMEEAERKEQQIAAKKPTSWIGGNRKPAETTGAVGTTEEKPFKQSHWAVMATENTSVGQSVKFAPLNPNDMPKPDPVQKEEPKKQQPKKQTGQSWSAANVQTNSNGMKFAPLQLSAQEQRLQQSERRQEQQMVFVSKKEQEQRRKKREERQKQLKAKELPK